MRACCEGPHGCKSSSSDCEREDRSQVSGRVVGVYRMKVLLDRASQATQATRAWASGLPHGHGSARRVQSRSGRSDPAGRRRIAVLDQRVN